jgi:hypothetical protein
VFCFKMADKIKDKRLSNTTIPDHYLTFAKCQKRKDKCSDIVLETKSKRFGIVPICLVENRLFRFGPEYALLDQIEISYNLLVLGGGPTFLIRYDYLQTNWGIHETTTFSISFFTDYAQQLSNIKRFFRQNEC